MKLYSQIRVSIVPSIWPEPLPYLVSEAIMQGRFVVASRIGGIPELVEGCKGMHLCNPGDPYQLEKALESVYGLEKE